MCSHGSAIQKVHNSTQLFYNVDPPGCQNWGPLFVNRGSCWQHVAGTFDGVTQKLYLNGSLVSSVARTGTASSGFALGGFVDAFAIYTAFETAEVRFWNYARPASEIAANLPVGSVSGPTPGLVALYLFNEGSGQTAFDSSGHGYHLQLGSSPGADSGDPTWIQANVANDTTPPDLSCPSSLVVLDPKIGLPGEVVTFVVTANDDCDVAPSLVCTPPSGSFFPRGTTMVTCTATDASGNSTVRMFPVVVMPTVRLR